VGLIANEWKQLLIEAKEKHPHLAMEQVLFMIWDHDVYEPMRKASNKI